MAGIRVDVLDDVAARGGREHLERSRPVVRRVLCVSRRATTVVGAGA